LNSDLVVNLIILAYIYILFVVYRYCLLVTVTVWITHDVRSKTGSLSHACTQNGKLTKKNIK